MPRVYQLDSSDGDDEFSSTETFENVVPGAYTVTEDDPSPTFDLTDLTCVDTGTPSTGDLDTRTAAINLDPGETVTCTFTNTKRGTINIVKTAVGGDDTFAFTDNIADATPSSGFSIDTATAVDDTETFTNVVPGSYTITETALPTGWDLTGLTCADPGDNGSSSVLATGIATIDLDPGETVSCTYTNTKRGSITVAKTTDGGDDTFAFTGDATTTLGDGQSSTIGVVPGAHQVTEVATAGWDLTEIICDDGNSSGDIGTGVATFNVEPGEHVSCTFTNTKRGSITVAKQTLPDGDPTTFGFTGAIATTLDDDQSSTVEVAPGAYQVTEGSTAGWDLTDITCDDANSSGDTGTGLATFNVEPGEDVSCTFTNIAVDTITIVEDTVPDGAKDFNFTTTGSGLSPFTLDDDAGLGGDEATNANTQTFTSVSAGLYTVSQTLETGWDLTGIECTGSATFTYTGATVSPTDGFEPGDNQVNILFVGGDSAGCTFTNVERGNITIAQNTDTLPVNGQNFTFSENIPSASPSTFQLDDDGTLALPNSKAFPNTVPGTYFVTQTAEAGWDLNSIVCGSSGGSTFTYTGATLSPTDVFEPGDNTVNITLAPGDGDVSCEFTNDDKGTIDIAQNALGDDSYVFDFTETVPPAIPDTFQLDGVVGTTFEGIVPGVYSVTQTVPASGWDLTGVECTSSDLTTFTYTGATVTPTDDFEPGDTTVNIDLAGADDTVSCTFTNTERGTINIVEDSDPDDWPTSPSPTTSRRPPAGPSLSTRPSIAGAMTRPDYRDLRERDAQRLHRHRDPAASGLGPHRDRLRRHQLHRRHRNRDRHDQRRPW